MDANTIGTWLGVAVSICGFGVAIWQIRRTQSAVAATGLAVRRTEARMASNALLSIVPRLVQLDIELSASLATTRTEDAIQALTRWRHLAAELRGLVITVSPAAEGLLGSLAEAAGLAALAEQALSEGRGTANVSIRRARTAVGNATAEAGTFTARLRLYTGEDEHA